MKHNKKMKKAIAQAKEQTNRYKRLKCVACNGSGRYDTTGSPKCGSCNGTGMEVNHETA